MKVKTRTQEGNFSTKRFRHKQRKKRLLQTAAAFLKRHELHRATDIYFKTFNRNFLYLRGFFPYFFQFSFQPQHDRVCERHHTLFSVEPMRAFAV